MKQSHKRVMEVLKRGGRIIRFGSGAICGDMMGRYLFSIQHRTVRSMIDAGLLNNDLIMEQRHEHKTN